MYKYVLRLALLVTALAALSGCGSSTESGNTSSAGGATSSAGSAKSAQSGNVGLSEFFLQDLGQHEIKQTFQSAAQAAGFQVVTTDANNSPQQQLADVQNLITQGVKAIVINPVDSAAIVPVIKAANARKIPVFTVDRIPTGGKVALTVRTNNVTLGQEAAQQMVKLLTAKFGSPKGNVLQITGDLSSTNALDRMNGFDQVMKQYPNIRLITKEAKMWDPANGAAITRAIVGAGSPKIDGIYYHSDFTGAGIIPALDQLGQKPAGQPGHIIVVGIDGSTEGINWIKEGKEDANISQPLSDFGKVVFKYGILPILTKMTLRSGPVTEQGAIWSPAQLVVGSQPGPVILLRPTVITKSNVNDPRLWGNQAAGCRTCKAS